jgi:F-type H+-transporting ATPase subunit b
MPPVSDDAQRGRVEIERASGEIQPPRTSLPSDRHEPRPARSTTARAASDAGVVRVARREAQPREQAAPPAAHGDQPAEHGEEPHEDAHGDEHGMLAALFWPTLNFLVLFGGLWYLLKQPLASYLKSRHETIRKDLLDAAALKAAATAQLEEIDRKLAALPAEIAALRARGAEEIAAEEARIAAEAAAERERLLEQTRREIDLQLRLARRALVEHAADLAVRLAADRIQQQITSEDQERLVGRYVAQIAPPA